MVYSNGLSLFGFQSPHSQMSGNVLEFNKHSVFLKCYAVNAFILLYIEITTEKSYIFGYFTFIIITLMTLLIIS